MRFKILYIFMLSLILTSCLNWKARKQMMADRFHGKHVDYLVTELGVPTGQAVLSDGGQILEFISYRGPYRCEEKFIADSKGIVIRSEHKGQNGCATPF